MKYLLPPALLGILLLLVSFIQDKKITPLQTAVSPLAGYSSAWNNPKYLVCNTAANASFLTADEKEVIYILNLARMNPVMFATTVVAQFPEKNDQRLLCYSAYYKSLLDTMRGLRPMKLLYPDSLCHVSALCHAITTGKNGTVTHDRTTKECKDKTYFDGECCNYGYSNAINILFSLLIDEGVPSLGHRKICLDGYNKIGVSIQPHTHYGHTAVLDFKNR